MKLIFSDTGSGIDPEKLEEIFEPFVTTKGEKGLGIGLWISRNIVEKLGGYHPGPQHHGRRPATARNSPSAFRWRSRAHRQHPPGFLRPGNMRRR